MREIEQQQAAGVRVAIIGLGRMGVRHVEAARSLGMDIVGAVDVRCEALADAERQHGIDASACYTDAEQMLQNARPEAAVVATTAPTHGPLVVACAHAQVRYILCEKPFATSLAAADEMLDACSRGGARLAVNHQMRYMPQYTAVKDMIGSEELGPLVSILVAGSNFGLAMNASHYFEMFRYLSGEPVHAVQAWFDDVRLENPRGAQFEDHSGRLLARAASGVTMYIDFSANSGWGLQVVYIFRRGQIVIDELNGEMRVASREAEFRYLPTSRYGMPAKISRTQIEPASTVLPTMKVWGDLIEGTGYPDGPIGIHALRGLVAAHVSNERGGHPTRLDDSNLPYERVFGWA